MLAVEKKKDARECRNKRKSEKSGKEMSRFRGCSLDAKMVRAGN